MLRLENVVKHYFKKDKNVIAVNDISCDFEDGSFVTVVGRSGSGKSTLLNLIGGLDTASSGHIYFQDKSLSEMKRKELELYRRFSIGMIFQSFNLINYYSAIENVILPMNFADVPRKESRKRAEMLLEQVGLADRMNHIPAELSGGEAQRVAIARSLANNPAMILADEPTGNLDSLTSDEIISLLIDLNKNKGISIIMITHEADIAHKVSDKIITLLDGKILNTQIRTISGEIL